MFWGQADDQRGSIRSLFIPLPKMRTCTSGCLRFRNPQQYDWVCRSGNFRLRAARDDDAFVDHVLHSAVNRTRQTIRGSSWNLADAAGQAAKVNRLGRRNSCSGVIGLAIP